MAVGYALIAATCWTGRPAQTWLFWMAASWIGLVTVVRVAGHDRGTALYGRPVLRCMGLRPIDSLRLLWVLAAASLLSGMFLWISAELHLLHRMYGIQPIWLHAWGYIVWAIVQEFILLDFVLVRVQRLAASRERAIAMTTLLFAGVHVPNLLLVLLVAVWGWLACRLFLRYRGLFALGLTHGLLGLVIAVGVPNSVHHHMRVGLGYLRYHDQTSIRRPAS